MILQLQTFCESAAMLGLHSCFVNSPQTETFSLTLSRCSVQPYSHSACIMTRCCESICPRQLGSVQADGTRLRLPPSDALRSPISTGTTSLNELSLLFPFHLNWVTFPARIASSGPSKAKCATTAGRRFLPAGTAFVKML